MNDPAVAMLERYQLSGDPSAFTELVHRYHRLVYAAGVRVGGQSIADDVAQETFLRLARLREPVHTSLASWLYRTAVRVAVSLVRSEAARHHRERVHQASAEDVVDGPEQHQEDLERLSVLDKALAELPDQDRDLVVGRYLLNQPVATLASERGISRQAVEQRLSKVMTRLRSYLSTRLGAITVVSMLRELQSHQQHCPVPAAATADLGRIGMAGIGSAAPATGSKGLLVMTGLILTALVAAAGAGWWWSHHDHDPSISGQAHRMETPSPHAGPFFAYADAVYQQGRFLLEDDQAWRHHGPVRLYDLAAISQTFGLPTHASPESTESRVTKLFLDGTQQPYRDLPVDADEVRRGIEIALSYQMPSQATLSVSLQLEPYDAPPDDLAARMTDHPVRSRWPVPTDDVLSHVFIYRFIPVGRDATGLIIEVRFLSRIFHQDGTLERQQEGVPMLCRLPDDVHWVMIRHLLSAHRFVVSSITAQDIVVGDRDVSAP